MRIGIIGCGSIGSGFVRAFQGTHEVTVFTRRPAALDQLAETAKFTVAPSCEALAKTTDTILIAVKPQDMRGLAKELAPFLQSHHTVLSVVTGFWRAQLQRLFPNAQTIALMPNLAVRSEKGVIGIEDAPDYKAELRVRIENLLKPAGELVWVSATQMPAVAAIAGSGLGFAALIMEAMAEAGIAVGLKADLALRLVTQTFEGAAALIREEQLHPAELRWQVSSPGGTTIEGIQSLEEDAVRSAIFRAVISTYERSRELEEK